MIQLRPVSEPEIVWKFLAGELDSLRFQNDILRCLREMKQQENLIRNARLDSEQENGLRRELLGRFRGYGRNEEMFERYPSRIDWSLCRFEPDDLSRIEYLRYCYWDELSFGTHHPADAARSVRAGREIYEVSNQPFLDGERFLRNGGHFPPIILLSDGNRHTVLEGNSRLTVYGLAPEFFPGTLGYVGRCASDELYYWNP